MKSILLSLTLLLCVTSFAQPDAYHNDLISTLSVQFTLTGETFPFYDTEEEYLTQAGSYNVQETLGTVDDQPFTQYVELDIPGGLEFSYSAGWNVRNTAPVALGDKILWVVYLRAKPNEAGDATARVSLFAERNDNFEKEILTTVDLSQNWQRYYVPMEVMTREQPIDGMTIGLHVGFLEQTIQVGGMAILNYGPDVPLEQLPRVLNEGNYGGFEADHPWRAAAAVRIEALRKADLDLTVVDADGAPLSGTEVQVRMQQHEFKFGTAMKGSRFEGGQEYNDTFVRNIFDLDGEGHGFNAMVFENDLKWPAWEQEWFTTNEQMRRVIPYLTDRGVHLRGHTLLWPGWGNMPDRMQQNGDDPAFLKQQVDSHLVELLETENLDEYVTDWDVLNEVTTNTDLATALAGTPGYTNGREFYVETFDRARELAPDASLYLNDYVTLSLKNYAGNPVYDTYLGIVQDIVDAGAPIDGIGFQSHLNSPNSILDVEATLDDFYGRFGLEAKITEFDLPGGTDSTLVDNYFRDFLTLNFSHPSMTGFLMWNWWDVDTWANPGANLYDEDWNKKPAHTAFTDLVFNDWWTEADLTTDAMGQAAVRGFKGVYELTLTCDGTEVSTTVNMTSDTSMTLNCEQLVSTRLPPLPEGSVTASPNPGTGPLLLSNRLPIRLDAELYDQGGRQLWAGHLQHGATRLDLNLPVGTYTLRFDDGRRRGALKLIRY